MTIWKLLLLTKQEIMEEILIYKAPGVGGAGGGQGGLAGRFHFYFFIYFFRFIF